MDTVRAVEGQADRGWSTRVLSPCMQVPANQAEELSVTIEVSLSALTKDPSGVPRLEFICCRQLLPSVYGCHAMTFASFHWTMANYVRQVERHYQIGGGGMDAVGGNSSGG